MSTDFDTTAETAGDVFAAQSATRSRRLWRLGTIAAAVLLATAVWALAVPIAGLELAVGTGPSTQVIGPDGVAVSSLLLGLAAWALLVLLEKLGERGRRFWQAAGWIVLVLSLAGPIAMGGAPAVLLTLLAMHLVVGVTVILGLAHPRAGA
ncbi:DUF6069 family protein [Agrococcus sp. ARC_14]|uniref:DUF6069 family protein n=1 Tax=Agrococcus sp. ARC_14 TaxID=2919927 RepID=UPI001F061041|nr:DUF6069 family protein [Agrococcus sp. ARC_14]MCH1882310.1 DUF6069 family protein [Agrococcus sp. ARC_14]